MTPKSLLAASWHLLALTWRFSALSWRLWAASWRSWGLLGTSWAALGAICSSNIKPGYHGTGSAFEARAASKASERRARRSQQTLQAETAKKHQEEQKPPRAGQQEHRDSEPGHATEASRRRCAPPPRRLELGAFPTTFPAVFSQLSGSFPEKPWENYGPQRYEETEETILSKPRRTAARTAANAASSLLQNRFKNAPKNAEKNATLTQAGVIDCSIFGTLEPFRKAENECFHAFIRSDDRLGAWHSRMAS